MRSVLLGERQTISPALCRITCLCISFLCLCACALCPQRLRFFLQSRRCCLQYNIQSCPNETKKIGLIVGLTVGFSGACLCIAIGLQLWRRRRAQRLAAANGGAAAEGAAEATAAVIVPVAGQTQMTVLTTEGGGASANTTIAPNGEDGGVPLCASLSSLCTAAFRRRGCSRIGRAGQSAGRGC